MSRLDFENTIITTELWLDWFVNLAVNRFTWDNLPQGLSSEILEEQLLKRGCMLGYESDFGLVILPCMGESDLNIYGMPTAYNVFSVNGKLQGMVNADDGVLLRNNPTSTDDYSFLEVYAKKLSDVNQTTDVNLFQQNIPKIILTDENGRLTAKALIDNLKRFKTVIFAKKNLGTQMNSSEILDNSAPYILDKLSDYENTLINKVLTRLAINNINSDKRERMIVDEVNANNDFININLDLMYDVRKNFCKEFNEKFGTNLKVKKREVNLVGEIHVNDKTNS